ncbi:hypothetical protein BCR42DRAFT_394707 [Absidia repens]|uniref:Uncharacterized protein n=1 Tax=Absidia repens TaxID=90262 RepID=A0A1X2I9P6_9FUNG|nr:hypothetical protein BCR42DRAFT_394707 [Absidia repens]
MIIELLGSATACSCRSTYKTLLLTRSIGINQQRSNHQSPCYTVYDASNINNNRKDDDKDAAYSNSKNSHRLLRTHCKKYGRRRCKNNKQNNTMKNQVAGYIDTYDCGSALKCGMNKTRVFEGRRFQAGIGLKVSSLHAGVVETWLAPALMQMCVLSCLDQNDEESTSGLETILYELETSEMMEAEMTRMDMHLLKIYPTVLGVYTLEVAGTELCQIGRTNDQANWMNLDDFMFLAHRLIWPFGNIFIIVDNPASWWHDGDAMDRSNLSLHFWN